MSTIIKADKSYRKKLLQFYSLLFFTVVVILVFLIPLAYSHHQDLSGVQAIHFIETIEALLLLTVIFPAIFLIRLGKKVLIAKEYPLPGTKMIRDTELKSGTKAVKIGKQLIMLGSFSIFLILVSILANHTINDRFIKNPFSFVPDHLWEELGK